MVRVNHPPGGKMKLNAEAEPDSRTVRQVVVPRVLKPPGGGSSIVFDEEENKPIKSKPQPQQQPPKEDTPQAETVEKQAPPPPQESGDAKPETNGMNSHDSVKEDAAASRDSFPSFPSPAPATNGQHSPAPNGSPAVNGSSAINGSVSSGSTSSMSPFPGGTPKHLNTQTRIFGEDHNVLTPRRRLRDHERSNIFADEGAANGTHRPEAVW
ncbi:hypothetical protein E2C01_033821 [Portunus trituberculatus]|uniref:Uncharacterized protein n=1 Tax=Portunus trituberculatus TaxID=210409 RepID=A0A5B7F4G9_PORTR|nr:hypothetical protein [Portunus trituberculatus]